MDIMIISAPSKNQHVLIVLSDNVDDSKVVEGVNILSEITNIVENTLIDSGTLIVDKVHVSSNRTTDDVDEIVESNIPAMPSKSFEFSCVNYEFMVVPAKLSSSESSEFLVMIQQMISGVSFFIGCLEFVPKFNIPPLERIDVYHLRHSTYLFFSSLRVMSRVPTILYLLVAHDDDITRLLANCENYKFFCIFILYVVGIYS